MSRAKQKGTSWETAIVNYLKDVGIQARRTPLTGALDTGDIELVEHPNIIIEAKNVKKMSLAAWVEQGETEATNAEVAIGPVWHKKAGVSSPGDGYVTMSGAAFTWILDLLQEHGETIKIYSFGLRAAERTIDTLLTRLDRNANCKYTVQYQQGEAP